MNVRCQLFFMMLFSLSLTDTSYSSPYHFRIANYNVENLFDLETRGTEYSEYIPGSSQGWGSEKAAVKVKNIAKVIKDINADIVTLEEIESGRALSMLACRLKSQGVAYPYSAMAETDKQAVGCAILSKFKIENKIDIDVSHDGRHIVKVALDIYGRKLIIYINHWKSKRGPESERLCYAYALKQDINQLPSGCDYIVVGDFNSNYDEYKTFTSNQALNDTQGITGINHVLGTVYNGVMVDKKKLLAADCNRCLYNLWLELPLNKRWSYIFHNEKETLDNILVPASLYDHKGISYVDNSFNHFAPHYLFYMHSIYRWQMDYRNYGRMTGRGYSDHLPVYADFLKE